MNYMLQISLYYVMFSIYLKKQKHLKFLKLLIHNINKYILYILLYMYIFYSTFNYKYMYIFKNNKNI